MTEALRVIVADDEALARRRIVRLLSVMDGIEIVAECASGHEVLLELARPDAEVDVLVLDVRMPGLSGLETVAQVPVELPHVIFTTAHEEHAVAAFEIGATDYLLKPIEAERLSLAIERARARLTTGSKSSMREVARVPVETRAGIVLVEVEDITHAVFDGELVTLHTERGALLSDYSLQQLEERLDDRFVRVHRRAILALHKVRTLEPQPSGGYVARLPDGSGVLVSRQAARRLRRRLGI